MIKTLYDAFMRKVQTQLSLEEIKLNDIQAQVSLSAIDVGFLPQSSYAMSPALILHVLNDVIINQRRCVLEFGSGISTIYLAKLVSDKGLPVKLYSVDEDAAWQGIVRDSLEQLGCAGAVEFITAPVDRNDADAWYDEAGIDKVISASKGQIDCVVVDAPSTIGNKAIRKRAIPFMLDNAYLSDTFCVFVDDTYREAEYSSALSWQKSLQGVRLEDYQTYCTIIRGEQYVSRPMYQGHRYRLNQYRRLKK